MMGKLPDIKQETLNERKHAKKDWNTNTMN